MSIPVAIVVSVGILALAWRIRDILAFLTWLWTEILP